LELPIEKLDDTVTRACLINEHEREYSLDYLARKYLGAKKDDSMYARLAEQFGGRATRNVQMRNIAAAPSEVVAPYATQDAALVLALWRWQEREIERQGLGGPNGIIEFERSVTPDTDPDDVAWNPSRHRSGWPGTRRDPAAARRGPKRTGCAGRQGL
jgi:hypothetical protein